MNSSIKVLTVALIFLHTALLFTTERMVVRFTNPDHHIVEEFTKPIYDLAAYRPGEFLDIVVTREELSNLRTLGYRPVITQTEERLKSNLQQKTRSIEGYRTYDDIVAELEDIADEYPDIVRLYNIGDSWAKIYTEAGNDYYSNYAHDIWALKLTTEPDSLRDRPSVYYMGAHHAREPLSAEVTMDFLHYLLERIGEDEEVDFLIDNTEIWFFPLVNPDGHKIVLNRVDVWWRKNIRDNNNNGRFDTSNYYGRGADGVDLNRNYAFEWRFNSNNRLATYGGPHPFSEPEVAVLKELMENHHFVAGISYHTYSELVLFPYGYSEDSRAPDHEALKDLAVTMAETIPCLDEEDGHYKPMQAVELYPARGTTDDYAYGEHGIFSFTLELGVEFIPPPDDVKQISEDNMEAAMILLRRIHHSSLTGIVTDAETQEPLEAEVYIAEIDETGSFRNPYRSRKPFGRYYRILLPGEYQVVFKHDDYYDSEPFYVTITEDRQTELNAYLEPLIFGKITGTVVDNATKEPISEAEVMLKPNYQDSLYTDEKGSFTFDRVPWFEYQLIIRKENYGTIVLPITLDKPEMDLDLEMFKPYSVDTFSDIENWKTTGSWGLSSSYSYIGNYSLANSPDDNYEPKTVSYAQLKETIDLSEAYNASVTFMTQYRINDDFDFCHLQVLTETEEEWTSIATFTGISPWKFNDIPLSQYSGQKINLRFLFESGEESSDMGIFIDDFRIYISTPDQSDIDEQIIYASIRLKQNFPNPFNPETIIEFSIKEDTEATLHIYNIRGQLVKALHTGAIRAGEHRLVWNGKDDSGREVASGVYFYRLKTDHYSQVKKMLLVK